MSENSAKKDPEIHEYAPLGKYSLKQRLLIYLADYVIYALIFLIGSTVRFEETEGWHGLDIEGYESFERSFELKSPGAFAFWHDRIFLLTYYWYKHGERYEGAVMSSQSFDGEYIARTAQRFGYGVIRGSSSRGGSQALKTMVRLAERGIRMTFTIDGPKGPRYRAKSGAVHFARHAGVPVAPILIEAEKFWTLGSWDKLQIPKPFTRAKMFVAAPVFVSAGADAAELKNKQAELQRKLDELVELGKQWRERNL
jgi:lysophospholipid acyltransferase (LPLAT)-like uncharacterized protein